MAWPLAVSDAAEVVDVGAERQLERHLGCRVGEQRGVRLGGGAALGRHFQARGRAGLGGGPRLRVDRWLSHGRTPGGKGDEA